MAMHHQLQNQEGALKQLILTMSGMTLRVDALRHSATATSCATLISKADQMGKHRPSRAQQAKCNARQGVQTE